MKPAKKQAKVTFRGGINIAVKIPKAKYNETVAFYRDVLQMEVEEKPIENPTISKSHQVVFGENIIWLDCVDNYTHVESWFEIKTNDVAAATEYLQSHGIPTCDELEQIPIDMHWIRDPSGTVFILNK
ncbi:MAG: VOC family protein [Cyclobacteriaceae bacterium]